jgi:signal transduction histidine kinase
MLYFSTKQRLYAQMDHSLENEMSAFTSFLNRQSRREFPYRPVRLMSYLVWDENGKLVTQIPRDLLDESTVEAIYSHREGGQIRTVSIKENTFRIISNPTANGTIQIAYNLDPERKVLDNLLFFIGIGNIGGVIIAVLTGFLLASRALIPIQKAWEQQQQFVSDASHELRTPLSVLQINLERLFRHPERTVEQESGKISVMIDETKRMGKLVDDLLTLARTDSKQLQIWKARVDLRAILLKVVEEFQDIAQMKGIVLKSDCRDHAEVLGDADRLHQLFVIVLDNALKYTKEGEITVMLRMGAGMAHITVADTGIGISQEDLPRIFDRFYRADKVRSRAEGGTGLGLSIAKWIVEAHSGTIQVESIAERGTVVRIGLPASNM